MNNILNKRNKVFLIGEIGINHNGDVSLLKIIKNAKLAGFDAVKFQKKSWCLCSDSKDTLETFWGVMSYLDYKKIELNFKQFKEMITVKNKNWLVC